ncbi:TIM barrel protein [Ulvibacterium sp.]|uniref:sugar phosphate isomerase/epimerase family protein n=1 Tax=Ulvibacterium sp. TaxID=2665914 RepID=UPI002632DE89|nr:TIM barrel protein [Ulvibacterium sp.]
MKNNPGHTRSRRKFLKNSTALATGIVLSDPLVFGAPSILSLHKQNDSKINGVQIGCITYSFRDMPDQSAEATLQYVLDAGLNAIELMGDPVEHFAGKPKNPLDRRTFYGMMRKSKSGELTQNQIKEFEEMKSQLENYRKVVSDWRSTVGMGKFEELKKMYTDKGVHIYAFKPNAFGVKNTDAEIDYGLRAAKVLGADHVTLELPGNDIHTRKLGTMASKHGMNVAYHGHTQQTPTFWDTALKQSEHNMMNLDLGHYIAAGYTDALELIQGKHERISSMHLKDRKNLENGQANLPFGKGDTPIVEVLQLMRDKKYTYPVSIELEYEVPQDSNSVKEVAKCLEYCRKALEG